MKKIDVLFDRTLGVGLNPYTVNVITFSGHGIDISGDAIAVIPELPVNEEN
jgi:hypothetical protein